MARPRRITVAERRTRIALRHRLAPSARTDDVAAIADAVVALHSTDPASVYLSAVARMAHPSLDAVDDALYERRTVVRHHAMRRTLWVMTPPVARTAHAACTTGLAPTEWNRLARMIEESGIADDGDAWVDDAKVQVLTALAEVDAATARQLGASVPALQAKLQVAPGKRYATTQGAHTRVLTNLGFDGSIMRGRPSSWVNSEYAWTSAEQWLPGGLHGLERDEAAADLARRYLAAFGPASTADLQWWAGWTKGLTVSSLAAVEAVEVLTDDGPAWVLPDDTERVTSRERWVAFLPALDPSTMGWKSRAFYLGDRGAFGGPLFDRAGNAGTTVWVDGEVVGAWGQRPDGTVVYRLLVDVPDARRRALDRAAGDLTDLLAGTVVKPRFPTNLVKELAAS